MGTDYDEDYMLPESEVEQSDDDNEQGFFDEDEDDSDPAKCTFDPRLLVNLGDIPPLDDQYLADVEIQIEQFERDQGGQDGDTDSAESSDEELFGGNRVRPEVYRNSMKSLNLEDFKKKHYSPGTLKLPKGCENHWRLYVSPLGT